MHVVTKRILPLTTAALFAAIMVACSDSGSPADPTGPNPSASSGPKSSGDSTTPPSGNPAPSTPPDSSTLPHGPAPQPVVKFTLDLHIGTQRPGAADTLTNDPLAGASVTVIKETTTFVNHPGADTAQFNDTVVATGTSGANGLASFADLDGTQNYKIRVAAPAGSGLGDTQLWIFHAYAAVLDVPVTLRKP